MIRLFLFFTFMLFAAFAHADNPFESRKHKLGIGVDYWRYKEPGVMTDQGPLYVVEYEFRNVFNNILFTQFSADIAAGITQYEGADLATGTPLEFHQTNTLGRLQFYVGASLDSIAYGLAIIPKIGILYRTLTDHDDEFSGDYQRDQEYFVVPIGLEAVYNFHNNRQFSFGAWFSASFSGTNKTYLTDVGGDRDLTLKQKNGSGFEVYFTYSFNQYYISGVFNQWHVDDSEFKEANLPALGGMNTFYEPENKTVSFGARVGFHF